MGTDFFDGLGETLTRTAKELGERAEQIYEVQKIRNKISGEERMVDKILIDMGNLVYKKFESGEETDPELAVLCEEVTQHIRRIKVYKNQAADMKGQKICVSCGKSIDKDVSYCPYCGTACTFEDTEEEPEEDTEESEDVISENWEDNFQEEPCCGSCEQEETCEECSEETCEENGMEAKTME